MSWAASLRALVAMLAIVNPVGAIPAFVGLTDGLPTKDRHHAARVAAVTVAALLITAVLSGEWVLRLFGIDINHFKVGGGILLLLIAQNMLHAQPSRSQETPEEMGEAGQREQIGAVPLGTPLLAGPGALSTAIIQSNNTTNGGRAWLVAACLLVGAATWVSLMMADPIRRVVGRTGINIATRLMGLLLAAMAVHYVCDGLLALMPGLAGR
jgi:multiple antibiotic resistance protein